MKFCKDCKWYTPDTIDLGMRWGFIPYKKIGVGEHDKCGHPTKISPVDGKAIKFCDIERADDNRRCGPEGRLWEAK